MKLVLFDIDGTLISGGRAGRRSLGAAFEEIFDLEDVERFMKQVSFNGRTDPLIVRDVARVAGIESSRLEDALEKLYDCYLQKLREITGGPHGSSLCPGFPELLEALEKQPGVMLGLLTGNIEAGARTKLEPFDLNRYFGAGGFGSDWRIGAPLPRWPGRSSKCSSATRSRRRTCSSSETRSTTWPAAA